jgi:hypothetical protein
VSFRFDYLFTLPLGNFQGLMNIIKAFVT